MKRVRNVALGISVLASLLLLLSGASGQATQDVGEQIYVASCSGCHQAQGEGIPGVFPPLAGHVPRFIDLEGGRNYLVSVLLYGIQGPIEVAGRSYDGSMPSWGQLSDEEIAAVLNHELRSWGNRELLPGTFIPILPREVNNARQDVLSPQQVHELRATLGLEDMSSGIPDESEGPTVGPQQVYSRAQADRGRDLYRSRCTECHGERLEGGVVGGPPLRGGGFISRWNGGSAAPLFSYLKAQMPQDRPGSMTDEQYAALMAYILSNNGYPAGNQELPTDLEQLQQIILGR